MESKQWAVMGPHNLNVTLKGNDNKLSIINQAVHKWLLSAFSFHDYNKINRGTKLIILFYLVDYK